MDDGDAATLYMCRSFKIERVKSRAKAKTKQ